MSPLHLIHPSADLLRALQQQDTDTTGPAGVLHERTLTLAIALVAACAALVLTLN